MKQYSRDHCKHQLISGFVGIVIIFVVVIVLGIMGYVFFKNQGLIPNEQEASEQTVTKPTTPSVTEAGTSDWKTYTNKEYGFSFKYPANWEIHTKDTPNPRYYGKGLFFSCSGQSSLSLSWFDLDKTEYTSLQNFIETAPFLFDSTEWSEIQVAKTASKQFIHLGNPGSVTPHVWTAIQDPKNDIIISLYFTSPCEENFEESIKNELDQILSTFEFLDTLTGYVAYVGNEPLLELAIVTGDGDEGEVYIIKGNYATEMKNQQGWKIKVYGKIEKSDSPYSSKQITITNYQIESN